MKTAKICILSVACLMAQSVMAIPITIPEFVNLHEVKNPVYSKTEMNGPYLEKDVVPSTLAKGEPWWYWTSYPNDVAYARPVFEGLVWSWTTFGEPIRDSSSIFTLDTTGTELSVWKKVCRNENQKKCEWAPCNGMGKTHIIKGPLDGNHPNVYEFFDEDINDHNIWPVCEIRYPERVEAFGIKAERTSYKINTWYSDNPNASLPTPTDDQMLSINGGNYNTKIPNIPIKWKIKGFARYTGNYQDPTSSVLNPVSPGLISAAFNFILAPRPIKTNKRICALRIVDNPTGTITFKDVNASDIEMSGTMGGRDAVQQASMKLKFDCQGRTDIHWQDHGVSGKGFITTIDSVRFMGNPATKTAKYPGQPDGTGAALYTDGVMREDIYVRASWKKGESQGCSVHALQFDSDLKKMGTLDLPYTIAKAQNSFNNEFEVYWNLCSIPNQSAKPGNFNGGATIQLNIR